MKERFRKFGRDVEDEQKHGYYRTKDTIRMICDALQHVITTGAPYQPLLANTRCCQTPRGTVAESQ